MNKWSHLPNAKHIDWVIQSVKDNPDEWALAWDAAWNAAYYPAREAAWNAARDAARDAVLDAARYAAYYAARGAAWNAAWNAAGDAAGDAAWVTSRGAAYDEARYEARYAVLALVAYDDIEHYFLSSYEELRLIAELSQHPGAILLLPAVKARELIEARNERVV